MPVRSPLVFAMTFLGFDILFIVSHDACNYLRQIFISFLDYSPLILPCVELIVILAFLRGCYTDISMYYYHMYNHCHIGTSVVISIIISIIIIRLVTFRP